MDIRYDNIIIRISCICVCSYYADAWMRTKLGVGRGLCDSHKTMLVIH